MFRLLRFVFSFLLCGIAIYIAVAVPLGQKTLWQHLRSIAQTEESKTLVREVKQKTSEVFGKKTESAPTSQPSNSTSVTPNIAETAAPKDPLSKEERDRLRRVIRDQLAQDQSRESVQ